MTTGAAETTGLCNQGQGRGAWRGAGGVTASAAETAGLCRQDQGRGADRERLVWMRENWHSQERDT